MSSVKWTPPIENAPWCISSTVRLYFGENLLYKNCVISDVFPTLADPITTILCRTADDEIESSVSWRWTLRERTIKLIHYEFIMKTSNLIHTYLSRLCLSSGWSSFIKDGCKLKRRLRWRPPFILTNIYIVILIWPWIKSAPAMAKPQICTCNFQLYMLLRDAWLKFNYFV